jgi:cytochrome b6-f complex iron-sulfur subunit
MINQKTQTPSSLPHEYEVKTGGGTEAREYAHKGLTRRQILRRGIGGVLSLMGAEAVAGSLAMFYPNLAGQFGSPIDAGPKSRFKAALPHEAAIDSQGVFYNAKAKVYIIHLTAATPLLLQGTILSDLLDSENWVKDADHTYWLALYQRCVHLGCKVPFRDDCHSFKCPCHGSHYNIDGEYLDRPAPRSLDRFVFSFQSDHVIVDTGKLNHAVERPDTQTRLISTDGTACSA